ncbi:MAG TPA: BamA/TamA family outer membrane protein [Longimicrobiaceae bacterium]
MKLVLAAALLALQAAPALAQSPAAPAPADAYLDPGARVLVEEARGRRARVERRIDGYRTLARERVYAGLRTLGRNRTLYSQEVAARVSWRRDGDGLVEALGGREAVPVAKRGVSLPEDLRADLPDLAFDPDELHLSPLMGLGTGSDGDSTSLVDPLRPGSEAHYRFRSGDVTSVRLPDGTTLRIRELEVIPRRSDWRLVRGSLWIDSESHGVVRSVFRLARPFELARDQREDYEEIPRAMRAVMGPVRADVEWVTVEYALWDGRWWLPRLISTEVGVEMGVLGKVPARFERSYSAYEVDATPEERVSVLPAAELLRTAHADSGARECPSREGRVCRCERGRCRYWEVRVPADTAALLASADLPPSLADGGEKLITGEEMEELARVLDPGLGGLGDFRPEVRFRVGGTDLVRYDRVEGLSLGARADAALGPLSADATVRVGTADREPAAELGVERRTASGLHRLAGYRRLAPFDPSMRALDPGSSLAALLLGRDEAEYLRATGVELTGRPARAGRWDWRWRLFAEHQHPVSRETGISLARAWSEAPVFPEVRPADRADQAGASLTVRTGRETPGGLRWDAGAAVDASAGTFRFARPSVSAGAGVPLPWGLVGAVQAAAGTTAGEVPVQGLWYLGGPGSVRGYRTAAEAGEAFWSGRAEVASAFPAARVGVFADAGWTGERGAFRADPTLLSAGVGAGLLDGLVRLDLARALRGDRGWRADLYLNGAL